MGGKSNGKKCVRRTFLKRVAASGALGTTLAGFASAAEGLPSAGAKEKRVISTVEATDSQISFPRVFRGRSLRMIAFPLGGIGTGTISLGGRGQLRDWEIFNRPDKGDSPEYCFPALWVQVKGRQPVARVLEARIQPPYEGASGLGSANVPGLPRLESAVFRGAFPFAWIDFHDDALPLRVSLEAFNPLVPLDVEASGLPIAILRYAIKNPHSMPAKLGVAYSVQNPIGKEGRRTVFREDAGVSGLFMDNPFLPSSDPLKGSLAICALGAAAGSVSFLSGWKRAQWWDGALSFWDDFTDDGALDSNSPALMPVGSIAVTQTIPAGSEAQVTFLIAWHFPNRTPARCGWNAVEGKENSIVGNYYTQRFQDAWEVSRYAARELRELEGRSRRFVEMMQASTMPPAVLDAALSNLSTLVTNTTFRTPDGEFHGFEGCNDHAGCCHGSCTHVWNYEQATAFVFPKFARSLRESEFLRNTMDSGLMGFRSYLPDGEKIWGRAAADGQMGCLMKLYREWQMSGDTGWLRRLWPKAKQALEFAWIKNGWDADRDGVMEGVQHNTYDVEFYGPNPLCGIWYLGALRAGEEMARAVGETAAAAEYRRLFENGSKWIDAHLFNGEYYIQQVVPAKAEAVAEGLKVGMGAADSLTPDYQMGDACLTDQLLGQYMAHVVGLGYLLDERHVKKTLQAIFRYNYRANLSEHASVQRTYALNDDAGVLVASYGAGKRPPIPFPYFAEVWTGLEYQFAAHLIYEGMVTEALTVIESARRRHDGERRNPWNEPECGHHYARAMSSWATLVALSGFQYSGVERTLVLKPRVRRAAIRCFWSAPSGWGSFAQELRSQQRRVTVEAVEGKLAVERLVLEAGVAASRRRAAAKLGNEPLAVSLRDETAGCLIDFGREIKIAPDRSLRVVLTG
jgi:uncharacterized protein (DUF608 family)